MLRVLRRALREAGDGQPAEFLIDASRQYVVNEYDAHWARPISMSANLLPPLGLIGTTAGLLALFLSKEVDSQSLELGALGLALISTIAALTAYAWLEAFKVRLYHRMLARLDDALAFFRSASARAPRRAEPSAVPRVAQS
jgi:flagellar motor component MotA